jgi:hypothetical protein
MRIASLSLFATFTLSALLAGPAAASDDAKDYTGAFCFDRTANASRINVTASGVAENTFGDEVGFICPVVKDEEYIEDGIVYVVDERPDELVSCKLRSVRADLTDTNFSSAKTGVAQHGDAPIALHFGTIGLLGQKSYVLHCVVPGVSPTTGLPSGIVMYEVDENN